MASGVGSRVPSAMCVTQHEAKKIYYNIKISLITQQTPSQFLTKWRIVILYTLPSLDENVADNSLDIKKYRNGK